VIEPSDDIVMPLSRELQRIAACILAVQPWPSTCNPYRIVHAVSEREGRLWFRVAAAKSYGGLGPPGPAPLSGDRRDAEKGLVIAPPALLLSGYSRSLVGARSRTALHAVAPAKSESNISS
jgi:hypothetical protein